MNCYRCAKPITEDNFVEITKHSVDEALVLGNYHLNCYADVVQYLQDQYEDWQNAAKSAPRKRNRRANSILH